MTGTGEALAKKPTRTERAAMTRQRVLDATLMLLHTQGYTGASTLAIRAAAGVSLGAMQHHFPTKAQLMAEVVRQLSDTRLRSYKAAIRSATDPVDALRKIATKGAEMMRLPETAAMLEIGLACRNDPDLARETTRIVARHDRLAGAWLKRVARAGGVTNQAHVSRMQMLGNAVLRGLTVDRLNQLPGDEIDIVIERWLDLLVEEFFDPRQRFG